jgi:RHS repeat-associated protein
MSVPLAITAGRGGFGPQLSLSYDSGSGNALFGFGWSLSAPGITRKTDKGLPQYIDAEESDVFLLSGAEDLVPLKIFTNGSWVRAVTQRTVSGISYLVYGYRPRIEGLFARIERWVNSATGETHWRSISRDNLTTLYGLTAESRVADPADPTRVFNWKICQTFDDKGNAALYRYKPEDSAGVDRSLAHERNRTDASRGTNRHLKAIYYGNRVSLLADIAKAEPDLAKAGPDLSKADWHFQIVFDYGEHDAAAPSPAEVNPWLYRNDPFSTYKPGFEVRTYRLCQRVLMFHNFPNEAVGTDCLVKSTDFAYRDGQLGSPIASFIDSITHSGYKRQADGSYVRKSMPQLEFQYSVATINQDIFEVDSESLRNLPAGLQPELYRWADLDGEGVPGILTEQGNQWFYKPNLGDAKFGEIECVGQKPSLAALGSGHQQLLDVAGDGQLDVVEFSGPSPGFFERNEEKSWEPFTAFQSLPNIQWDEPNLRFVDLDGDGHADVLITETDAFTWHHCLAREGFGEAQRIAKSFDEERGPALVFADGTQSVYLADMSGDGLSDLVRVRNSEICYWPNLGFGRFGAKVTMDNAPLLDFYGQFDQKRVRLADVDGSGTTDLIYLGVDGARIYFNQSGNSYGDATVLDQFPVPDNLSSVTTLDLLGNGTACLVWSSPLPGAARRPMLYIDLMGGQKPHLLLSMKNNLGAESRVQYASSTKFYLADKAAGQPWVTRLAFPVHVVERMETYDYVSRNRFVTRYTYHHGFYDGIEREFRGFGRVDSWDTEEYEALATSGVFPAGDNVDASSHVPPKLTRTWSHTGAYFEEGRIAKYFEHEYYREGDEAEGLAGLSDAQLEAMSIPDTVLPSGVKLEDGTVLAWDLTGDELRESCRALKGSMLRQEVYGLDGSEAQDRPYSVAERNYTIDCLQPRDENLHAVFSSSARESVDFHYERKLYSVAGGATLDPGSPAAAHATRAADPRVSHTITLEVDSYGNVVKSAAIGYGRRFDAWDPVLTPEDRQKQKQILLTYAESSYTNAVLLDDAHRVPLPSQASTYELIHVTPDANQPQITNLFRFDELRKKAAASSDGQHELPYEDVRAAGATTSNPYRRLISQSRTVYRKDDLTGALPQGALESMALPVDIYTLVLTPGLLKSVFQRTSNSQPAENLIPDPQNVLGKDGGYVDLDGDGNWWAPSGRVFYSPSASDTAAQELAYAQQHFFNGQRFTDPFHQITTVLYDACDMLAIDAQDPVGNRATAGERDASGKITLLSIDYRMMKPFAVMDPNRNRTAVAFDILGLVVGTAVMGKPEEKLGDSLDGFTADLDDATIQRHLADPLTNPQEILQNATTRLVYDLEAYRRTQTAAQPQPSVAYTLAREMHVSDLASGQQTVVQHCFSYSDGFAREIQKKAQAEPGPLVDGGPAVTPRWVGSGWTIFNNKGKPVRQYEPFFTATSAFEFANTVGVSPILFYDPVERVVATIRPNHTYEKVVFDPWRQATWDTNDTVLQTDPRLDADVGGYFARLAESDYLPTWYAQRSSGALGAAEQAAAAKASVHGNTPLVAHFDTLGRGAVTVAHNRSLENGEPVEAKYATRSTLDIQGDQLAVTDSLGRTVVTYDYGFAKQRLHQNSMDAGERWMLSNVSQKPFRDWNSRGFQTRTVYDALRRPVQLYFRQNTTAEILAECSVYGEMQPGAETQNLRGKLYRHYDCAGVATNASCDFKGNITATTRQLANQYQQPVDWTPLATLNDATQIAAAAAALLQSETFTNSSTFDALNRLVTATAPDGSVRHPVFNEANLLEQMSVNLRGAATATAFVTNVDYNAKGQRTLIEYGNGAQTSYSYDSETFRLTELKTTRASDKATLQDLAYAYDPVGNITSIADGAQQTIYFSNQVVTASADYTYDATYRLIAATGRENIGQVSQPQTGWEDVPRMNQPLPTDGQAMRNYVESYAYDAVGNFLEMVHQAASGNWTRTYAYDEPNATPASNRLTSTTIGTLKESYSYDGDGNMIQMPHLPQMTWDFKDQLASTERQVVNNAPGETTFYVYDSSGKRVRKVTQAGGGAKTKERIYLGGYEVYCEYSGGSVTLERQTLHVMDDKRLVAMAETETTSGAATVLRYQFDNHLGSAALELDANAAIISYEEYYPYGSTSYEAVSGSIQVSLKRYRYTGKERDEETGLYYHGARYFAAWLGRWSSCDPKGLAEGACLYRYCGDNPVVLHDPTGTQGAPPPGMIANDARIGAMWEKAVVETLGPRLNATSYGEVVKAFEAEVAKKIAANGGALGSNKAAGTAINFARTSYAAARTRFGQLLAEKGISLSGVQVHHMLDELAKNPFQAITTTNLMFTKGQAGVVGSGHNFAHAVGDAHAAGVANPGQAVAADMRAKGIKPDVPELSGPVQQPAAPPPPAAGEAGAAVKTEVKEGVQEGAEVLTKEVGHAAEESGLKAGAKFLGKKAAKYTPILGVGVAIVLVAKDVHAGEYGAAAWDAAEGVPGVGDGVGLVHLTILGAQAVPGFLGKMFEGQREKDVAKFDEQNPGAPPEAFDQLQKAEENFNNGQF